jgi:outer membrane protein TolC
MRIKNSSLSFSFILLPFFLAPEKNIIQLSVQEAVLRGLKKAPQIKVLKTKIKEALANKKIALAQFGPKLQIKARGTYANEAPSIKGIEINSQQLDLLKQLAKEDPFDNTMLNFLQKMPNMFQSEQYDLNLQIRILQPLTGLYQIYQGYKLAALGVDIAHFTQSIRQLEIAFKIKETCYKLLSAIGTYHALKQAIKTTSQHLNKAYAFHQAELVGLNDVLKAKVHLAEIKGRLLKIKNVIHLLKDTLKLFLNLLPKKQIKIITPSFNQLKKEPNLTKITKIALLRRPEIKQIKLQINQAKRQVQLAQAEYIPQINAFFQYQQNKGSMISPPSFMAGAIITWPLWEWGTSYYHIKKAKAKLQTAQINLNILTQNISLEVKKAILKLKEAKEQIKISEDELRSAKEQFRIEKARYDQHLNTSTEVLTAQTQLTKAQVKLTTTKYEYLTALALLKKAIGETL